MRLGGGQSLHERLRRETARSHGRVENLIAASGLFTSLSGYADFLRASLAFQEEAERALADCDAAAVIPDWPQRQRARLARSDLRALGWAEDVLAGAGCHLIRIRKPEWVLGVAYVVEGATLGGAILLKTVASLNVGPERAGSFLESYGPDRGRMWQTFLSYLAAWERVGIDPEAVVGAATAAFDVARCCFEGVASPVAPERA